MTNRWLTYNELKTLAKRDKDWHHVVAWIRDRDPEAGLRFWSLLTQVKARQERTKQHG